MAVAQFVAELLGGIVALGVILHFIFLPVVHWGRHLRQLLVSILEELIKVGQRYRELEGRVERLEQRRRGA